MKTKFRLLLLAAACASVALSACGDSRSDAERIADAYTNIEQSRIRAAVIEMRRLLQSDPDNAQARVALGTALLRTSDAAAAEKEFLRAKKLGAAPDDYLEGLARALAARGAHAELIAEIEPEIASSQELASTLHALRAMAMLTLGSNEEAERIFDQELAAGESVEAQRIALVGKAAIARMADDLPRAQSMLEQALEIAPDSAEALVALADLHLARGDFDSTIAALDGSSDKVVASPREQALLGVARVEAHLGLRDIEKADQAARRLRQIAKDHPMTTYLSGRVAAEQGDYDVAVDFLQQSLAVRPNFPPAQALMGMAMFQRSDYEQAEIYLSNALAANPANNRVRQLLAETRLRTNRPKEAQQTIREGMRGGNTSAELMTLLGRASIQAGESDEGIEFLRNVLERNPGNPAVTVALASAYLALKQGDKALELLDTLPEGAIDERRMSVMRVLARFSLDDPATAQAQLEELLAVSPGDADILTLAGNFYLSIDEHDLAREQFEALLEAQPDNRTAMFGILRADRAAGDYTRSLALFKARNEARDADMLDLFALARIYLDLDEHDKALVVIKRANAFDPAAIAPNLYLASEALGRADIEAARQFASAAVTHHPREDRAHGAMGMIHLRARELDAAIDSFEKALELAPKEGLYHYFLGEAHILKNDTRAAGQRFRSSLESRPGLVPALRGLGFVEVRAGNGDGARRQIVELQRQGDNPAAQEAIGDLEAALGNMQAAYEAYQRSANLRPSFAVANKLYQVAARGRLPAPESALREWVARAPSDTRGRMTLAQVLMGQGKSDEAIAQYEAALELAPDSPVILNNLSWLYFERAQGGDRGRALELAKRAFDLVPDNPDIGDTYGWLLYQDGRVEDGLRTLQRSLRATSAQDKPDIAYHVAVALTAKGDTGRARALLDAALNSSASFQSREDAQKLRESL